MRSASPKVVLLVTALFCVRPVKAAMDGALAYDQAALRVMISMGVAWVLVGVLTGVARSFLVSSEKKTTENHPEES